MSVNLHFAINIYVDTSELKEFNIWNCWAMFLVWISTRKILCQKLYAQNYEEIKYNVETNL